MATIQIRNITDEDYQALRKTAHEQGKSLQSYMLEEATALARRARKKAAFDAVEEAMKHNKGTGVTTEDIIEALDEIRGPWPGEEAQQHGA